ncbi:hypothetical protein HHI36_018794 [Cryptolaemus montrouzieri]|uniref:Uncharacterized protein n=1 Tax=Cryptolaemus montrouzieri TaxID=559131 RepID=A0ABD2P1H1_9CUCU
MARAICTTSYNFRHFDDEPINIPSKIFQNGNIWLQLNSASNPYRCSRLYEQDGEYMDCRNEVRDETPVHPVIYEFDDEDIMQTFYEVKNPVQHKCLILYKLKKLEKAERILNEEWNRLAQDENHFRKLVCFYEKSFSQNVIKRSQAKQKSEYFEERIEELDEKIAEMGNDIEYLRKIIRIINYKCEKHEIYENFCTRAAELRDYGGSLDLIQRYLSLKDAAEILLEKNRKTSLVLTDLQSKMNEELDRRSILIHTSLCKILRQTSQYDIFTSKAMKYQNICMSLRDNCLLRLREFNEGLHSITAIFNLIKLRRSKYPHLLHDYFDKIPKYIESDMKIVREVAHRILIEDRKQNYDNTSSSEGTFDFCIKDNIEIDEKISQMSCASGTAKKSISRSEIYPNIRAESRSEIKCKSGTSSIDESSISDQTNVSVSRKAGFIEAVEIFTEASSEKSNILQASIKERNTEFYSPLDTTNEHIIPEKLKSRFLRLPSLTPVKKRRIIRQLKNKKETTSQNNKNEKRKRNDFLPKLNSKNCWNVCQTKTF